MNFHDFQDFRVFQKKWVKLELTENKPRHMCLFERDKMSNKIQFPVDSSCKDNTKIQLLEIVLRAK